MQRELFASPAMSDLEHSRKTDFSSFSASSSKSNNIAMDRFLIGLLLLIISYVMIFSWGVDRGRQKAERAAELELRKLKADVEALSQMTFDAVQVPPIAEMADVSVSMAPKSQKAGQDRANSGKSETVGDPVEAARNIENSVVANQAQGDENGPVTLYARPTGIAARSQAPDEAKPLKQFTIQLATYVTQGRAEKQVAVLKDQGFEAFVVPSGSFFLVCVDRFPSKDLARSMQHRIQQETGMYLDAYIRTVPSI